MIITGDEGSEKKPAGAPKILVTEGFNDPRPAPARAAGESDLKTDESWKEKAKREKEKLAEVQAQKQEELDRQLPPASFLGLVEDLAVRAMFALGQLRDPSTQEAYIDLEGAKYVVELLGMLEQKTRGNLDANEEEALKGVLHNLRMTFLQVTRMAAATMASEAQQVNPAAAPGAGPAGAGPGKPGPKIIY